MGIIENQKGAKKLLNKGSFGIDVFKLASGTTIAQALGILVSPILTRFYDPKAFGIFAIFTSVIAIIGVISCLRYEFAIMLPETDEEAANLLVGSIIISVVISLLLVPIVWLGGTAISRLLNSPELGPYLWLVPPTILLGGVAVGHPALNYWVTRNKHFGWLSVARISGSIVTISTQLIFCLIRHTTGGNLIIASVLGGGLISTFVLARQIWLHDKIFIIRSFNLQKMFRGLKRYYKFPLYDSWAGILNIVSGQLPTLFLATLFSSAITGLYSLGGRILNMPMTLIGSSIAQVFYQRAAVAKKEGKLTQVVESTFSYLVIFGMFPFLVLTIVGKDLFVAIFGSRWSEAGVFTQILSIWYFFCFISAPLSVLFKLLEKQNFYLFLNAIDFVARVISLVIGGLLGNLHIALLILASSGIFVYGYTCFTIMKIVGLSWSRIFRIIFSNLLRFIPAGIVLFLVSAVFKLNPWFIVGISIISIALYFFSIIRKDSRVFEVFSQYTHLPKTVTKKGE
jgi:lipopolysaccharide exporter